MTDDEALKFAREVAVEQIAKSICSLNDPMEHRAQWQKDAADVESRQRIIEAGRLLAVARHDPS